MLIYIQTLHTNYYCTMILCPCERRAEGYENLEKNWKRSQKSDMEKMF